VDADAGALLREALQLVGNLFVRRREGGKVVDRNDDRGSLGRGSRSEAVPQQPPSALDALRIAGQHDAADVRQVLEPAERSGAVPHIALDLGR
jgi:hypothetical protein